MLVLAGLTAAITLGPTPVGMLDAAHEVGRWLANRLPGDVGTHPSRGETEALLNVVVPAVLVVGIAWAWPSARLRSLLTGALIISAGIEVAQVAIPGRQPHLRDLVLNGVGACIGAAFVAVTRRAQDASGGEA